VYSCPECGSDQTSGEPRCRCGADLRLLQQVDALADVWFNRALAALAEGATGQALEWLAAACVARPTDVAARIALSQVWAQLGRWKEAADALERAAELDPGSVEVAALREALRQARGEAPHPEEKQAPVERIPEGTRILQ
jgi:tetratricopeptide (TPR) repeat protein